MATFGGIGFPERAVLLDRAAYFARYPPSITIAWPVVNEAASEQSQTTASATSPGSPRRSAAFLRRSNRSNTKFLHDLQHRTNRPPPRWKVPVKFGICRSFYHRGMD